MDFTVGHSFSWLRRFCRFHHSMDGGWDRIGVRRVRGIGSKDGTKTNAWVGGSLATHLTTPSLPRRTSWMLSWASATRAARSMKARAALRPSCSSRLGIHQGLQGSYTRMSGREVGHSVASQSLTSSCSCRFFVPLSTVRWQARWTGSPRSTRGRRASLYWPQATCPGTSMLPCYGASRSESA